MTDHDQPDLPLDPAEAALGEAASSPFGPTSAAGEQPRLGIIHLLVWMACVAFYLGVFKGVLAAIPWSW